ncbi:3-deoxy-manno-octulosonate cytidylyltransferase [Sphingobium sufflavum]|uniref:3-deoxy-manno-octulosonate cytidylyltransferase n=1 Tax=Sphingobium sufflavum TaxID=1129547 RepID=UPI001F1D0C48|nr:manno-octulosonate cytidylyltransferase [Sphingobium sufflavum]MCE7798391.1 3-deoxy-manno-octulosonate cytidylyltransferase [Sphingobium sufflavum]
MTDKSFAIIIPARFASTRHPGKPLALLQGASGERKTLIRRTWECASSIKGHSGIWIATDDERIATEVRSFGGQVVITSAHCRNGTERCAEAVAKLGDVADIVVNLQGDAPLTPTFVVRKLVDELAQSPGAIMTTPAVRCSPALYDHLISDQAHHRVGGTTVVFDNDRNALYFSKRVIPHRPPGDPEAYLSTHLHLGVYAYTLPALAAYAEGSPTTLENLEGLEQLRFLEGGLSIRMVPFDPIAWDCIELNNPEDAPAIEAVFRIRGIA